MAEHPAPGLHYDVPFATYCQWPLLNGSTLVRGLVRDQVSYKHLQAALDGRLTGPKSRAVGFGRAGHAALLEPDVYLQEWVVKTRCRGVLGSGPNKGAECGVTAKLYDPATSQWYCLKHAPKGSEEIENVVGEEEAAKIPRAMEELRRHKAAKLLRSLGGCETSLVWQHAASGLTLKGRLDKLVLEPPGSFPPTIVDVKFTARGRADDETFSYTIRDLHYDVKAALYVDGVAQLTGTRCKFLWLVIEDDEPFEINVIQATPDTLAIGRAKYRMLLRAVQWGRAHDHWPAAHDDVHYGGLPDRYVQHNHHLILEGQPDAEHATTAAEREAG